MGIAVMPPAVPPPPPPDPLEAVMAAVWAEVADTDAASSVAVTTTSTLSPTSVDCSVYVLFVAPGMFVQVVVQSCHW
jgi:hypothetical protein